MRKAACNSLTAGMLSKTFNENFIATDKSIQFHEYHQRDTSLLEEVFVGSYGNGQTIRCTNVLFDTVMC